MSWRRDRMLIYKGRNFKENISDHFVKFFGLDCDGEARHHFSGTLLLIKQLLYKIFAVSVSVSVSNSDGTEKQFC
jgi:hypothetical protein